NTKQMVAGVAAFRERYPSVVNPLLDAVDGIAETFQALVATTPAAQLANHPDVARLIGLNHVLLSLLGVSHTALDTIRDVARRHGLAAKMTGGGGGGCALVWIPEASPESAAVELKAELEGNGFACYDTAIGGHGLRVCDDSFTARRAQDMMMRIESSQAADALSLAKLAWSGI
ncbi:Mevalonate kinase, partial [Tieghemiomyces parasiticus]